MTKAHLAKLGPQTSTCSKCGRVGDSSWFSMLAGQVDFTYASREWYQLRLTCNPCRIKLPGQTGYQSSATMWQEEAMCAGLNEREGALFFPLTEGEAAVRLWAGYCDSCPVRQACLEFGRQIGAEGVWGGIDLTPRAPRGIKNDWCRSGRHRMTEKNTVMRQGHRLCKACYKESYTAYNARKWELRKEQETPEQREKRLLEQRERDAKRPRAVNAKPRFTLQVGETCKKGGHLIESEDDMRTWVNARGAKCHQCRQCHNEAVRRWKQKTRGGRDG